MSAISLWQILIILLVIGLLFGMGRLPQLGKDLGKAIQSFRRATKETDELPDKKEEERKRSSKS